MSTTETPAPAAAPRRNTRGRSVAVWIVLALAGLLLLLSAFAVWIDRVALNTDVFTATSREMLADDEIRGSIGTRSVDELFANVDVQAELEAQLPTDYKGLSGPATAGLRQASYQIIDRALEQPVLQRLFEISVEQSHETLVQVLEGGGDRISTEGGQVTLELRPIVVEAADQIGLGQQVADNLPANAGSIVILESDELDSAQDAFQLLKTLAWVLPLLTLVAFALAIWIARDRRRAVRGTGWVLVMIGIAGLVAARLTRNYLVDSLVAHDDDRQAASNAWDILTDLMRQSFRLMFIVGLLFVVAAWLAGPSRRAVGVRSWLAPVLQNRWWAYAGLGIVALLLLFTTEVADFSRLLVIALLLALGAAWIELTRRQTVAEFPGAESSTFFTDTWDRVTTWWDAQRTAAAEKQRQSTPASTPPATDVSARLSSLAQLHASGALTDEEYASAKARVLAGD
jgi:Short C-terminal domain